MKIDDEDTPCASERKPALAAAAEKYRRASAKLEQEYVGIPYDARFSKRSRDIRAEVEAALCAAMPFHSLEDVVAALDLEAHLSLETFEGGKPKGLDATRLNALQAAAIFLTPKATDNSPSRSAL